MTLAQGSSLQGEGKQSVKPKERKQIFTWEEYKRKERARYCRLQKDTKRVCAGVKKRKPHKKEKEERTAKREPLREKEKSKVLPPLKKIISVRERVKKNKSDFSLAVKHTQELL